MKKKKAKKTSSAKDLTPQKTTQKKPSKKRKVVKIKTITRRPTEEEYKQFNKDKRLAKEYATDKEKTSQLLEEAIVKARRNKNDLQKVWEGLLALFRLIRAWSTGEYRKVPWRTILSAIAAIIYLINPFDAIPDFIPGFGYVDDAAVIAYVIKFIQSDLEKFLEWEQSKK